MTTAWMSRRALLASLGALSLALGACGSDEPGSAASGTAASSSAGSSAGPSSGSSAGGTSSAAPEPTDPAPPPDQPFGPACAAFPAEGEGSLAGMADDPVATAAGNSPALSTLAQALAAAALGVSVDDQPEITVLAPANPAFEALRPEALQALLADNARLTAVLTHHVISGRLAPDQLAGTHTTLNNDPITIERQGDTFRVPATGTLTQAAATVICGNVQTANATVYVVDQVLAPPAA